MKYLAMTCFLFSDLLVLVGNRRHHRPIATLRPKDGHISWSQRANQARKSHDHRAIQEAKVEEQRPKEAHSKIVQCYIGAVPHDDHLNIARRGRRFSFVGEYATDPTSFETLD